MDRAEDSTPRVLGAYRACRRSRKEEEGSSWSLNVVGGVACVRACVRADTSSLPRGCLGTHCSREGRARNSDSLSRRALDGDLSSQDRRATRRDVRRGGMEREGRPCACARSLAGTRVLYVRARTRIPMCARTCVCERTRRRARARLYVRARGRARGRERGWLAHWRLTGGPTERSVRR